MENNNEQAKMYSEGMKNNLNGLMGNFNFFIENMTKGLPQHEQVTLAKLMKENDIIEKAKKLQNDVDGANKELEAFEKLYDLK